MWAGDAGGLDSWGKRIIIIRCFDVRKKMVSKHCSRRGLMTALAVVGYSGSD
jgi:hypothetical protein